MFKSDLNGATAIVTGSGSGIGRAIARRLAGDGATVAVDDVDEAAAFLVSDDASFITGQVLSVSGGLTMAD